MGSGGWAGDAELGPETGPSGQASLFPFSFIFPLPPKFKFEFEFKFFSVLGQVFKQGDPIYDFGVV